MWRVANGLDNAGLECVTTTLDHANFLMDVIVNRMFQRREDRDVFNEKMKSTNERGRTTNIKTQYYKINFVFKMS